MTKAKTSASEALTHLSDRLEQIRHTDPVSLANMEVGDEHSQGDLGLLRLDDRFVDDHRPHLLPVSDPPLQLARGSTQGSRHCLDSLAGVEVYSLAGGNVLDGPILRLHEPRKILHPEHGDLVDIPPGDYGIQYQRQFAEELRAARD